MDTAIGSTPVPESSGRLSESVPRDGNREPSKRCEEQNQSQPHAAPTQSGVRFKIRSARERQESLNNANTVKSEAVEKASRSIKDYREEMPTIHTISPLSPNTDMIDKRKPRVLNQLSLMKTEESPVGSEKSSTIQKKPDCPESPSTKGRGRTEWRQGLLSNRSKSLDWRVPRNERGQENQMEVFRNTKELEGRAIRRSESLERNSTNVNKVARPLKRVSLQIHPFSGAGQKKQDSNALISPDSGTSARRIVALAQSFPSILKGNQSPERTEERKSPWHSGHSSTKSDQAEHHGGSRVTSSKVSEITGNHTVMEKNGLNVLKDNSTKVAQTDHHVRSQVTASKVNEITGNHNSVGRNDCIGLVDTNDASAGALHSFITPAPFCSFNATGSNLSRSKSSNSSLDKCSSFSSISKVKTVAYNPEKGGTFPKAPFKKQQMAFTTVPDTFVSERKDNLVTTSTGSKEKPLSQESSSLMTNNSASDGKRQTGPSIGQGTRSLGRARIRHFTAPISYPSYCPKETEGQIENITSNSNQTKGNTTSPGKPHSSQEGVTPWTKPPSSPSEFGSSGNSSKKSESSVEKVKEPSLDSVRNTIHKFEALAQQNQSSARIQHPRRALSVIEMPKSVVTLNKTYSARSLGIRSGDWSKEYSRENLFSRSEVSNDAVSDLSGPVQITTRDKEVSRVKTQTQETGVEQMKLLDEFPSSQKKETKFTVMNKHMDEPDFSKGSNLKSCQKNITNSELTKETVKDNHSSATSHNSKKSSGTTNVSHSGVNDFSSKPESKFSKATKDKPFLTSGNTPVLANSDSSTAVKSTGNSARSKSSSSLLNDSVLNAPFQVFPSTSGELSHPYNTIKDEKVAEKVIRWIMDKGVDDLNDDDDEDDDGTMTEYDSDSGESTVTITSNMSSRSFSMSLVELCSLGGLDLPPSDGTGSKDDENWMSKRTVSMSSDVSALSSVTLLSMDELDCLLNDVRNLEDDALENYEDVHVVVLHKDAGNGLGFTVAGGVDQNKPVTVHTVLRNGVAAQEGSIHVGDQVLSINGTALRNSTHKEAHNTVRKAKGRTMAVVVIRRGDVTDACCSLKDSPQKVTGNPGSRELVTLNKSSSDLGFSLEGGVGSALGDKPLTVQRLFQGGPVGKVFPGDELLEVGGQSLEGLRRLEVWQLIRRLPPGPVEVLLQRPRK